MRIKLQIYRPGTIPLAQETYKLWEEVKYDLLVGEEFMEANIEEFLSHKEVKTLNRLLKKIKPTSTHYREKLGSWARGESIKLGFWENLLLQRKKYRKNRASYPQDEWCL